jgi:hypothetical protein
MDPQTTADILMSIGMAIGFVTKSYAIYDKDTTWPRRSSGTNVITYPITGIAPLYLLGLNFALLIGILKYLQRVAIYIWRAPGNEDWLGRKH